MSDVPHDISRERTGARPMAVRRRAEAGFTVTELVVTVTIAAILGTMAVPSFRSVIASQRAKTSSSELFAALLKARSDAIQRNANVSVAPNTGGWGNGWQTLDAANNVLDNHDALTGVVITQSQGPGTITYGSSGRLPAGSVAPMFVIAAQSGPTNVYQCVSVDLGGRPYTQQGQTC